ncbi:MAG: phosphoribosylamine--glycine ligase [Bdellovibrionaceae bacterium]|nr:phosphoribosylamine--glycine ligase [Pseudobdellovibrionaceae bacterium]
MRILVIGKGGREHAIVRSLSFSPKVEQLHAIPGSDGMRAQALCHDVESTDFEAIYKVVKKNGIELVIIGPEIEIALGLADFLIERKVLVFSPGKEAAKLEASKIFCKEFLQAANIPTAKSEIVKTVSECMEKCSQFTPPYVLKADGLAAGKGVFICKDKDELQKNAEDIFDKKTLGSAGNSALLEQCLKGWELSYLIITNGMDYRPLPLAQDHKRLLDNDQGPNTGGMGVVAPLRIDLELEDVIHNQILKPTVEQLSKNNLHYRGVLYVGIMVTEEGPKVLEFNVRFGDPEAQVIMPLLDGDWVDVFKSAAMGELLDMNWKPINSCCVVLAAPGYPDNSQKGVIIEGHLNSESPSSYFLHAGTSLNKDKEWLTHGGRVLNAIGLGSDLKESIQIAYNQASKVSWEGMQMRKDIGQKILKVQ